MNSFQGIVDERAPVTGRYLQRSSGFSTRVHAEDGGAGGRRGADGPGLEPGRRRWVDRPVRGQPGRSVPVVTGEVFASTGRHDTGAGVQGCVAGGGQCRGAKPGRALAHEGTQTVSCSLAGKSIWRRPASKERHAPARAGQRRAARPTTSARRRWRWPSADPTRGDRSMLRAGRLGGHQSTWTSAGQSSQQLAVLALDRAAPQRQFVAVAFTLVIGERSPRGW